MFYKMVQMEIRRSLVSTLPVTKFAWEVPVIQMAYGPDNVALIKEVWIEKEFIEAPPSPASEYERMQEQYGKSEQGIPFVVMAYGQVFEINRTLAAHMRDECVSMVQPKQLERVFQRRDAPPSVPQATAELMALKRIAESTGNADLLATAHALFQKHGLDWMLAPGATLQAPPAVDETDETGARAGDARLSALSDSPLDVPLPDTLDPNGKGVAAVTKTMMLQALVALGSDPDEQATRADVMADLDELMKVELTEKYGEVAELEGESIIGRYTRIRPLVEAERAKLTKAAA